MVSDDRNIEIALIHDIYDWVSPGFVLINDWIA